MAVTAHRLQLELVLPCATPPANTPLDAGFVDGHALALFTFERCIQDALINAEVDDDPAPGAAVLACRRVSAAFSKELPDEWGPCLEERAYELRNACPDLAKCDTVDKYRNRVLEYIADRNAKLQEVAQLVNGNHGKLRADPRLGSYDEGRPWDEADAAGWELSNNLPLPDGYRQMLLKHGPGLLYVDTPSGPAHLPWVWHRAAAFCDDEDCKDAAALAEVEVEDDDARDAYGDLWGLPATRACRAQFVGEPLCIATLKYDEYCGSTPLMSGAEEGALPIHLVTCGPQRGQLWTLEWRSEPVAIRRLEDVSYAHLVYPFLPAPGKGLPVRTALDLTLAYLRHLDAAAPES